MMRYIDDTMTIYGNIASNIAVLGGHYKIMASYLISQKPCRMLGWLRKVKTWLGWSPC